MLSLSGSSCLFSGGTIYTYITCIYQLIILFRKLAAGDLAGRDEDDGLLQLAKLCSIDVGEIGVGGAKNFFEAKIKMVNQTNKFEDEIREEQEENKIKMEEKKTRQEEFKKMQSNFS